MQERCGIPAAAALTLFKGLYDLRAVRMVLQRGHTRLRIVYHASVRLYPRKAEALGVKLGKTADAAVFHARRRYLQLVLQLLLVHAAEIVVHTPEDYDKACNEHRSHRENNRSEDFFLHALASKRYPTPRTVLIISPHCPSFWRSVRMCISTVRVSP